MNLYFPPNSSAKVANEILMKYYGISIFKFAQALAIMAHDPLHKERELGRSPHEVAELKRVLTGLKHDILQGIQRVEQLLSRKNEKAPIKSKPNLSRLIITCGLDNFFNGYYSHTMELIRFYEANKTAYKGAVIKKSSLVAAGWGNMVQLMDLKIRWDLLADLYEWFWDRLKPYDYYRDLKPTSSLSNYLKIQYYRHKMNPTSRDLVLVCCARSEGLTILAKDWSLSDAYFYALSKYSEMNKKAQSKYVLREYLKCALDLYSNSKVSPDNGPPLIVFPDKSFFSTSF
ncbi:hypothetical protein IMZ48_47460 [Candidatus Bathyarchaeota archaeon]|nr:hypothetical protein [Candidatus Bathyarchaeota archaeon]